MRRDMLSVKLDQREQRLKRLHTRIYMGQTAGHSQLRQKIDALEQECAQAESALEENLRGSKSAVVSILARGYGEIEQTVQRTKFQLQAMVRKNLDEESWGEAKLLAAEYALDFAHQAANRAALLAMDAIDTQLLRQETEERSQP